MLAELGLIFVTVITPVFALVVFGFIAARPLGLQARTLSRYAYYLLVPAFVFNVLSSAETEADLALRMITFIVIVHILVALIGYLVARVMGHTGVMAGAFVLIAIFGNVGNFGLPLIEFRFGAEALEAATIYFLAILTTSFIIGVAAANWTQGGSVRAVLAVIKTPALLALVPAVVANALDWQIPLPITRITGLLGAAMVPTMLVALGVQLAYTKRLQISRDVLAASAVRLIAAPLLAVALAAVFGITGLARGTGIIQSGMPAAVLCSIIALEYDLAPDFVTTSVLFSTIASVVTLTVLLAIV